MSSLEIKHHPQQGQNKKITVSIGERVYMNYGAMFGGEAGTVTAFSYSELYGHGIVITLDNGNISSTHDVVEYGIGCYLERLGGLGTFAKKR